MNVSANEQPQEPGEGHNVQVVQEIYAAFGRGDLPAMLAHVAEDIDWYVQGPPDVSALYGRRRSREEVAQFFAAMAQEQDIEAFELQEFVAQGATVVVLGHYRARMKATGKTEETEFAHVHTFREGKVVRFREYADTAAAVAARQAG